MTKKTILGQGAWYLVYGAGERTYIATTFAFDDANQLVSSTTDGVTTRYAYDAAGRMVREGSKRYTYGYLDKVMSVTDGDTTRTFTYHADGQLASATVGSALRGGSSAMVGSPLRGDRGRVGDAPLPETETFLWDGLALIQRGDEQFVNEPHIGGGNPVASSKGTSYFNDALGTTVGAKKDGKYSAAALTAFGENYLTTQPPNHQTFFTGKPYVEGLGHAFLMRNYRAGLAKWQTADPMGYPDGWNQLAYCGNGVTECVDLLGAITEHNVSFGWYYEWQGFSIAYNPLLWSFDLPFPRLPVKLWNELAKYIGSYIREELSDLTPLYEAFLVVEQIDLVSNVRYLAGQKAMLWFDNVISVEVTDVELLKVEELKMDVIKNGNGDVFYVQFEKVKALYLVHMKVIVE